MQTAHVEAAAAAGFTHFDTAPLYGFGGGERALGAAFASAPEITIATKVGLYPPGGANQGRPSTLLRKAAGKLWPSLSRAIADHSVERARASLESSLNRLRRDYVDLLLIHEPGAALLSTEEWLRWLEDEKDRVRNLGIAGPAEVIGPFLRSPLPLARVIQTRDSTTRQEADIVTSAGRPLQLTYGYFSSVAGHEKSADIVYRALARNPRGSIVVSTKSLTRLDEFARAANAEDKKC